MRTKTYDITSHILFTLLFYDLNFMSGGGEDGGFVTGDDAAVTAFSLCTEMFVSVKPLDILRGPCYNF